MAGLLSACTPEDADTDDLFAYTFPDIEEARPAMLGPGGPTVAFDESELFTNCAFMERVEEDRGLRNTVVPWRGHLLLLWSNQSGDGGFTFFEMDDPCDPVEVGFAHHLNMRETHALPIVHLPEGDPHAGTYAAANGTRGIMLWDMTDMNDVQMASYLTWEDVGSFDAYQRNVFSVAWQYPYVYAATQDVGLIVLDATDPTAPVEVTRLQLDPILRMGNVVINGTRMLMTSTGENDAAIFDISDPTDPQLQSRFDIVDAEGAPREAYGGTMYGDYAAFARKDDGSGPILMDVSDPLNPTFVSDVHVPGSGGGYVFFHEGFAFMGQTNRADVYDFTDVDNPVHVGRGDLEGDLDTLTPYGNVAILATDDEGAENEETAVMPWRTDVDTTPPTILTTIPRDGDTGVALTARVGFGFSEMVEPSSVFPGSVRLHGPDGEAIEGWAGAQEAFGWYTPKEPLLPESEYTFTIAAGGIVDVNDNAIEDDVVFTFTTGR